LATVRRAVRQPRRVSATATSSVGQRRARVLGGEDRAHGFEHVAARAGLVLAGRRLEQLAQRRDAPRRLDVLACDSRG
jgi:hypothetical protein